MKKVFDKFLSSHFLNHNPSDPEKWHLESYENLYGKFLPKDKKAKILDIGSGMGQFLWFLKKKGYQNFQGVDISKECINFCQKKVTKKVKLIKNLQEFLRNNQNYFDLIVMNDILEHFKKEETLETLENVYKALKKDGSLFIKTANASNLTSFCLRNQDFTHEISFTESSLSQVLRIAGFSKIKIFGEEGHWLKTKLHSLLMRLIYRIERGGLVNPTIFSQNLIAIAKKHQSH